MCIVFSQTCLCFFHGVKALENYHLLTVARERFFNRVVKTNLFQLGVWGRCKPPAVSGEADFDNNLLKIN